MASKAQKTILSLEQWCKENDSLFLLKEWNCEKNQPLTPQSVSYGSNKKVWWICSDGHSYEARIANRTLLKRKCPYCSGRKTITGFNDFETWCRKNGKTDLLDEWDYAKNDLKPSEISPSNSRKVWWKCSLGHEWQATLGSRTSKHNHSGCPYCSNPPKQVLEGFNDFETWCKKNGKEALLEEWDYAKNNGISPKKITFGSGKRVWWKCGKGHEWSVSPANRVQGTACPVCARTQTSFPEQAIAFYLAKAFRVIQRYRRKGFEIDVFLEDFNIGIEYDGMFFHNPESERREREKDAFYQKHGCLLIHVKESEDKQGIDGNNLFFVLGKSNYLDENFNNALRALFDLLEKLTGVHFDKDADVIKDQSDIRSHYLSVLKKGSVSELLPTLVSEWDTEKNAGLTPDHFSAHANIKVWWKCKNGHSWQAVISSRARGLGCPFCAGQRTIGGVNDLESWCKEHMPELLLEWDYERNQNKPSEVSPSSNKKVWWKCKEGHVWQAIIANRIHGNRCPFCFTGATKQKMSFADWCRKNGKEEMLAEWDYERNKPLTPEMVSKGSHKKVWWRCSNGHEWEAEVKSRTYNHGCPFCSGTNKKAVMGVNDLVTWCRKNDKEYILKEWDYEANGNLLPEMFTFGSHARINWICSSGHKWSAVIKERTKPNGNTCPYCKKEK